MAVAYPRTIVKERTILLSFAKVCQTVLTLHTAKAVGFFLVQHAMLASASLSRSPAVFPQPCAKLSLNHRESRLPNQGHEQGLERQRFRSTPDRRAKGRRLAMARKLAVRMF